MKTRCYSKRNPSYKRYGKRGITICREWKEDFLNFQKWALDNGYQNNLTIDRIDNDGNYCPENCRWVSNKINHRNNSFVKVDEQMAEKIRNLKLTNPHIPDVEIAKMFPVGRRQINNIVKRRQWV